MKQTTLIGLGIAMSTTLSALEAQDRSQSRSMAMSQHGIAASENVLASQVGASILEHGGNAIDAAVAMNAMMGLVAPMNDGIGGDLFAIVYDAKSRKLFGLNASGWSPRALTAQYLRARGMAEMPQKGINSVTVPGAVDGWDMLLRKFGRKTFADVLAPAIMYAEEGFPVGEVVSAYWHDSEQTLKADGPTAKTAVDIRDGVANTILIAEMSESGIHWMQPCDLHVDGMRFKVNDETGAGIRSKHPPGGAYVLFADGKVQFILDGIDPGLVKALTTIAGGEDVSKFWNEY